MNALWRTIVISSLLLSGMALLTGCQGPKDYEFGNRTQAASTTPILATTNYPCCNTTNVYYSRCKCVTMQPTGVKQPTYYYYKNNTYYPANRGNGCGRSSCGTSTCSPTRYCTPCVSKSRCGSYAKCSQYKCRTNPAPTRVNTCTKTSGSYGPCNSTYPYWTSVNYTYY